MNYWDVLLKSNLYFHINEIFKAERYNWGSVGKLGLSVFGQDTEINKLLAIGVTAPCKDSSCPFVSEWVKNRPLHNTWGSVGVEKWATEYYYSLAHGKVQNELMTPRSSLLISTYKTALVQLQIALGTVLFLETRTQTDTHSVLKAISSVNETHCRFSSHCKLLTTDTGAGL